MLFAGSCLLAGLILGGLAARAIWGKASAAVPAPPLEPVTALPDDWRDMEAGDFFLSVEKLLGAQRPPTIDHQREVMEFAWTRFLSDPQFAAQGDWETVVRAVRLVPQKRADLRNPTETVTDQLSADGQLNQDMREFRTRVLERIATDEKILTGGNILS